MIEKDSLLTAEKRPLFHIKDIPIYGDAILSPMAGYSDVPYRALCRAYGSAMNFTEFVPVEALQGKPNRFWQRLDFKRDEEKPMVFQIFGNNAQLILNAALRIEELGPDIIDINMGCSTRKVSGRGAGAGMMPQPELVAQTFSLLSAHLSVPVTGKIRLGWDDDQRNYVEIAKLMEENGAALISMHARTKVQKYGGKADWDEIAHLREAVGVPVIGNGDVETPADIERMKLHTGCDAVMIGRAAIGNPWIFARQEKSMLPPTEIVAGVRIHLHEMVAYYGEKHGLMLFRKHFKRYVGEWALPQTLMRAMLTTEEMAVFLHHLDELEATIIASFTPMQVVT